MKVIICNNKAEFDAINDRIHQGLIENVKDYNADRWDEYNEDLHLVIEPRVEQYLTEAEIERIVNYTPEEVLDE